MEMLKISHRRQQSSTFRRRHRTWPFHIVVSQRTIQKCTKSYNARAQLLFCSLYNTDGPLFGDLQNVLHNENHEKFQHFRSPRKKSSLTTRCIVNGKISGRFKGFSSLIKFVKVSFTVDLACSSKSCLSQSAESNLDNQSPLSLLFLVVMVFIFCRICPSQTCFTSPSEQRLFLISKLQGSKAEN